MDDRQMDTSLVMDRFSVVHTNDSGNRVIGCMRT
jgi:hypothetical protein